MADDMVVTFGVPAGGAPRPDPEPSSPPVPLALKTWRAVHNVAMWYPAKVTGVVLVTPTNEFRKASGEQFTPRYEVGDSPEFVIMSGSVFETALPPLHEQNWLAIGAIVPVEANVHLNLEDVFPPGIADQLRQNGIFSLEDVAREKPVEPMYSWLIANPEERQMRQFLLVWSRDNKEQVEQWIQRCRDLIAPPAPVPPARAHPKRPAEPAKKEE